MDGSALRPAGRAAGQLRRNLHLRRPRAHRRIESAEALRPCRVDLALGGPRRFGPFFGAHGARFGTPLQGAMTYLQRRQLRRSFGCSDKRRVATAWWANGPAGVAGTCGFERRHVRTEAQAHAIQALPPERGLKPTARFECPCPGHASGCCPRPVYLPFGMEQPWPRDVGTVGPDPSTCLGGPSRSPSGAALFGTAPNQTGPSPRRQLDVFL